MPGSEGMKQIQSLMARFRQDPPHTLAGFKVRRVRDYLALKELEPGGKPRAFDGPVGDMVMIDLGPPGTYVAVRPSGTEPKVKFYTFTFEPAEQLHNLEETKAELAARLDALAKDLTAFSHIKA